MKTINTDKTVTIEFKEYKYKATFTYDNTDALLSSLTIAKRTAFAAAKETEILNDFLAGTRIEKNAQLNAHVQAYMDSVMSSYSPYEQSTFNVQQTEWSAYTANSTAQTPYIDALAVARGITKTAYIALVGKKVNFFAGIQGKQYAVSDVIKAATTKAAIEAVVMPILP